MFSWAFLFVKKSRTTLGLHQSERGRLEAAAAYFLFMGPAKESFMLHTFLCKSLVAFFRFKRYLCILTCMMHSHIDEHACNTRRRQKKLEMATHFRDTPVESGVHLWCPVGGYHACIKDRPWSVSRTLSQSQLAKAKELNVRLIRENKRSVCARV